MAEENFEMYSAQILGLDEPRVTKVLLFKIFVNWEKFGNTALDQNSQFSIYR